MEKRLNRGEILKILKERREISGEEISQILGISRTAVWKHIKTLIKKGYPIEISKKGYKLMEKITFLSEEEFLELPLKVYCFKEISSTMDIARKVAERGEEALIVAETQTSGRGRLNRTWVSPKGGIWISLVLRPKLDLKSSFILTYIAGLATALSIEEETGLKIELKWPNDVLYKGKKLAGILLEIQAEPERLKYVILGIGINANNQISFLEKEAISLKEILNKEVDRNKIISNLINNLKNLLNFDKKEIISMWKQRASTLGKEVKVITLEGEIIGKALDIDEEGALVIQTQTEIKKIYSGDCIHLRKIN